MLNITLQEFNQDWYMLATPEEQTEFVFLTNQNLNVRNVGMVIAGPEGNYSIIGTMQSNVIPVDGITAQAFAEYYQILRSGDPHGLVFWDVTNGQWRAVAFSSIISLE